MSRIKFLVACALVVGLFSWMVLRSGKTASANETASNASMSASYGENTEEVAAHRWQHNAPRHWRSLVVKR